MRTAGGVAGLAFSAGAPAQSADPSVGERIAREGLAPQVAACITWYLVLPTINAPLSESNRPPLSEISALPLLPTSPPPLFAIRLPAAGRIPAPGAPSAVLPLFETSCAEPALIA